MIYPDHLSSILDFDRVLVMVGEHCRTFYGRKMVENLPFITSYTKLRTSILQLSEFQKACSEDSSPQVDEVEDVDAILQYISREKATAAGNEIHKLGIFLRTGENLIDFVEAQPAEDAGFLRQVVRHCNLVKGLSTYILNIVAEDGSLSDNASPELKSIRKEKDQLFTRSRKAVQDIFQRYKKMGYVPEGASISVKNGRTTVPVLSEFKRRVNGYVQDESATGQTSFIEPAELIVFFNEGQDLELRERREVQRILADICIRIRQNISDILKLPAVIGKMDEIYARYNFLLKYSLSIPDVVNERVIKIREGYHFLLKTSNDVDKRKTIPLDLVIDAQERILIISGPNAGGKSVALKTVGLLQMMLQSGLPVPVGEGSVFGVFEKIICDIGDNQSIDDDLSTYSSHLACVAMAMKEADESSLLLFDEFGSGTEPRVGGAIAQAVLEQFATRNCRGVITTHYHNIKELAQKTPGLYNGAMRYHSDEMKPLYILDSGKPGQSFAVEIAFNMGISEEIIERAKFLAGHEVVELDRLLARIDKQKWELESREKEIDKLQKELNTEKDKLRKKNEELDKNKKSILKKAVDEADQILSTANKEIEKTIRHIKTSKAHKEETRKVRKKLEGVRQKVQDKKKETVLIKEAPSKLSVGDRVRLEGQNGSGIIRQIKGNSAEIEFGEMTIRAKLNRLEFVQREQKNIHKDSFGSKKSIGLNQIAGKAGFSTQLNIRGMRAEEAVIKIDKFLDNAILYGVSEVSVLHGKGEGVLRQITRDIAKKFAQVADCRDDHADRGGTGITIITIK